MTIPNVIISWCQRAAQCRWCEQSITKGTPMVKVFFWNKGDDGSRRWNISLYYHFPDCYSKQGMDYLNRNPYVPKIGRKNKPASEDRRKRFLLIRRFNELHQRKSRIVDNYPDSLLVEVELTKRMVDVMLEVAILGGVPKSWSEKLV